MGRVLKDCRRGTVLALLVGAGTFLLVRYGFGRLYYLGALLPAAMMAQLLVAWLIHLRSDGFFGGARQEEAAPNPPEGPYATFGGDVIERANAPRSTLTSRDVMRALLWSAAELGLASIALYHLAGIGAELL